MHSTYALGDNIQEAELHHKLPVHQQRDNIFCSHTVHEFT